MSSYHIKNQIKSALKLHLQDASYSSIMKTRLKRLPTCYLVIGSSINLLFIQRLYSLKAVFVPASINLLVEGINDDAISAGA